MDPMTQIAAALLCYTGVIDVHEARELAGFPSPHDTGFQGRLKTLARFVKETGRDVPPVLANWWPVKMLRDIL